MLLYSKFLYTFMLPVLRNRFFGMRHGHSVANLESVVCGLKENDEGLSDKGSEQAKVCDLPFDSSIIIYSSDFPRARETAEIVQYRLRIPELVLSTRLRERSFGELEGQDISELDKVWSYDFQDPNHRFFGVESAEQVGARVLSLVHDLNRIYSDKDILLVSHGDPLHILETYVRGIDVANHMKLPSLKNAEIREYSVMSYSV